MRQRSPVHVALGRAVREHRARLGVSQERLAELCDMHRTFVGGIERGEKNPTVETLERLSAALGVRASQVLARGEELREELEAGGR